MVRKEGDGVREAASPAVSRRREKAPRFGQQARCALHLARACGRARAIRRANRAGAKRGRAGAGAGAHYARIRVPPQGQAGGGVEGTEWNETGWRNDIQDATGRSFAGTGLPPQTSSPARGRGWERVSGRAAWQGPGRTKDGLPPRPSLASEGGRHVPTSCPKQPQDMSAAHADHDTT